MDIKELFNPTKMDLSCCDIGDLLVYTVNGGDNLEIGYVTFNGWSEFWKQNIVKVDGTICYFAYDGNWIGDNSGKGYAIKRFPKYTLKFKCTSDRK